MGLTVPIDGQREAGLLSVEVGGMREQGLGGHRTQRSDGRRKERG